MIYARYAFVTAAKTQVLSVETALIMDGGEDPTSIMCIDGWVQNSAWVEFWER